MYRIALFAFLIAPIVGCTPKGSVPEGPLPVAVSLTGGPLFNVAIDSVRMADMEADLHAARKQLEANPGDADALIWVGRRLAYLGRYKEAIDTFSEGMHLHPEDPRMYRHRGHRFITLRQLDRAVNDLTRAASLISGMEDEIEPDGMPNPYNIPTSTLGSNIWYHLGLAHYLRGEFPAAKAAFIRCMDFSTTDDMKVATADWLYMTLRRLGEEEVAASLLAYMDTDLTILENHSYHRRLQFYRGQLPADTLLKPGNTLDMATQGYGVGNWYLYNGEAERAREVFEGIVEIGNWPAFGHIAAEAEIARISGRR
jgi:tetratricopeptide (TPR) repeat protein